MRLKTFLATYLLFLCILYSSLGIVSAYMTNSQVNMLKEKSASEYSTITASLVKDIAILYSRSADFHESVNSLVNGYARYYRSYNIDIAITDLSLSGTDNEQRADTEISFIRRETEHFIHATGTLPEPFQNYSLDYTLNITKNVMDMQNIQNVLLLFAVIFSIVTVIALHFILSNIFKPLNIVANTSKKIAEGQYCERINIKGKNELSVMALNFNRMAEKVEKQIIFLEEESIAKQQFADNLAHEIRTPLTSIYGYAEYMQKALLDEKEIIESAQQIMDEASHMKNIANSLLELATLRNYVPLKDKIFIPRLFDDIRRSLETSLREHNIKLVCQSDEDVLSGQEDLIKSLLLNLCLNALKACAPDDGVIHLCAEKQGESVILSVTDNGYGIPNESISNITEPFYRVDKARSREHGGAGLGLALCKQIAAVHNAEMTIESAVGEGTMVKTTFTTS